MGIMLAIVQVEIDVLTGEKVLRRTDILFDCGHSLNPGIDIGQVRLFRGFSGRRQPGSHRSWHVCSAAGSMACMLATDCSRS